MLRRLDVSEVLASCRHVHFACAPEAEFDVPLFKSLRRRKCTISIDVQSHVSWLTRPESMKILKLCDMFFPNEREVCWVSSEVESHDILLRLRDQGVRGVGIKLGAKGAALLWKGRQYLSDPFPVETLDTTGAGDCFDAGFIFAWLRGNLPERCLRVANICGALSTRALGGIAASSALDLPARGVDVVGPVPRGLPTPGLPSVAVEAGVSQGWERWVDRTVSIDRFGASAPGAEVLEKLGITAEHTKSRAFLDCVAKNAAKSRPNVADNSSNPYK